MCARVDFPDPGGPTIPTVCPGRASKVMSVSIFSSPNWSWNAKSTCSNLSIPSVIFSSFAFGLSCICGISSSTSNNLLPDAAPLAHPATTSPNMRTGVRSIPINARNCASCPRVNGSFSSSTLSPPTSSTNAIAMKKAIVIRDRFTDLTLTSWNALLKASLELVSYLCISYSSAAKDRTTLMPFRFSSMILVRFPISSW